MTQRIFMIASLTLGSILAGCRPQGPITADEMTVINLTSAVFHQDTRAIEVCGPELGAAESNIYFRDHSQNDHFVIWVDSKEYHASRAVTADNHFSPDCLNAFVLPNETPPSGRVKVSVTTSVNKVPITNEAEFTL